MVMEKRLDVCGKQSVSKIPKDDGSLLEFYYICKKSCLLEAKINEILKSDNEKRLQTVIKTFENVKQDPVLVDILKLVSKRIKEKKVY